MKLSKKVYVVPYILFIFIVLGACTPRIPISPETKGQTQSTSQNVKETAINSSQTQITVPMVSSVIPQTTVGTKAIQTDSRPTSSTEMTPEIEKNRELFLEILSINESAALGIAVNLYRLGIGELVEASVVPDDLPVEYGYSLRVKDADNAIYYVLINQRGSLSRVYRDGEKEPIFAVYS